MEKHYYINGTRVDVIDNRDEFYQKLIVLQVEKILSNPATKAAEYYMKLL